MIVRTRYTESATLLQVASITAQSEMSVGAGGQIGVGPATNYAGNIVPFSIDGRYRETPTISYTPVSGDKYFKELLTPIELDMYALLVRTSPSAGWVLPLLTSGLGSMNAPIFHKSSKSETLDRTLANMGDLVNDGVLSLVFRLDAQSKVAGVDMVLANYAPDHMEETEALMQALGKPMPAHAGDVIRLAVQTSHGTHQPDALRIQTRSTLELLQLATMGVEVPQAHLEARIAMPNPDGAAHPFIHVRSSSEAPADPMVAVQYRGYWFYVDSTDIDSKRGFLLMQMMLLRCLDDKSNPAPLLSLPL